MKISILGSGWLGLPLAEVLCQKGFDVSSTYANSKKNLSEVSFFQYELGDDLPKALLDTNIFILTIPPGLRRNPLPYVLAKHQNLIDQLSENTFFIYTSSTSAYSKNSKGIVSEETPADGAIRTIELMIEKKFSNHLILRLGGLAGPKRPIVNILSKKRVLNNYNQPTNLLHLEDAYSSVLYGIINNLNGIYNVCATEHQEKIAVYNHWCEKLNYPILEKGDKKAEESKIVSNKKIKDKGYIFRYDSPYDFKFE